MHTDAAGLGRALVLLALSTVGASSQTTSKPKPISNYMREVGLTYLEEVENLQSECMKRNEHENLGESADNCESALDRWEKIFAALERRIDLTLRESKRPAGDIPFFKLLQDTRLGESIYLRSSNILFRQADTHIRFGKDIISPEKEAKERELNDTYLAAYINCNIHAEQDIKSGFTEAYARMQSSATVATNDDNCLKGGQRMPSPSKVDKDADTCAKRNSCEAEARSWPTQTSCEREGFAWIDGVCHAKSK
jgi:hypothetical protein